MIYNDSFECVCFHFEMLIQILFAVFCLNSYSVIETLICKVNLEDHHIPFNLSHLHFVISLGSIYENLKDSRNA